MEGVLSACYHVCPNYSNFQFGKLQVCFCTCSFNSGGLPMSSNFGLCCPFLSGIRIFQYIKGIAFHMGSHHYRVETLMLIFYFLISYFYLYAFDSTNFLCWLCLNLLFILTKCNFCFGVNTHTGERRKAAHQLSVKSLKPRTVHGPKKFLT